MPVTLLLATRDNTAIAFEAACPVPAQHTVERCDSASHSFATTPDKQWLFERVLAVLTD